MIYTKVHANTSILTPLHIAKLHVDSPAVTPPLPKLIAVDTTARCTEGETSNVDVAAVNTGMYE